MTPAAAAPPTSGAVTTGSVEVGPRRRARRGEGAALRDELLAAATAVLVATGDAERITIRAVAAEAGVSPPSVYLHFPDRDALVFAICEQQFQAIDDAVEAATRPLDAAGDPLGALRARAHAYVAFGLKHPEQYRILFMCSHAEQPLGFDAEALMRSAAFDHLLHNVDQCLAKGVIRAGVDPMMIALAVWTHVHGITSLRIAKPTFPWPPVGEFVDFVCDATCFGLCTEAQAVDRS